MEQDECRQSFTFFPRVQLERLKTTEKKESSALGVQRPWPGDVAISIKTFLSAYIFSFKTCAAVSTKIKTQPDARGVLGVVIRVIAGSAAWMASEMPRFGVIFSAALALRGVLAGAACALVSDAPERPICARPWWAASFTQNALRAVVPHPSSASHFLGG